MAESKYDMRICKCGRIHMVDNEKINKALTNNKHILLICAGCGHGLLIGADIEPDWDNPNEECFMMYSYGFSENDNKNITVSDFETTDNHKGIEEIFYSHGYKVPMMSGMYATNYSGNIFSDTWYPDFYKIQRRDITVKEVMEFIDKYTHDRTTVNMDRFIRETPEDVLETISHYYIKAFNFKGTKWETKWNSK